VDSSDSETPGLPDAAQHYAGLVSRTVAFGIDAAVINVVALIVALGVVILLRTLHLPHGYRTTAALVAGAAFVVWSVAYFIAFWCLTGQTIGDRVMQLSVERAGGQQLSVRRALVRYLGMLVAAVLLFVGFVPILFDRKRRGLHDRLADTVVIELPGPVQRRQRPAGQP
jgi:uncharacterized RDD family membrane protein YckC